MSRRYFLVSSAGILIAIFLSQTARGDLIVEWWEKMKSTWEIDNLHEFPDWYIIAFPWGFCSESYEEWSKRCEDPTAGRGRAGYEVLQTNKRYPVVKECGALRLYALPRAAFPSTKTILKNTPKRWERRNLGDTVISLKGFDELGACDKFRMLEAEPIIRQSGFSPIFPTPGPAAPKLKATHDILHIQSIGSDKLTITGKEVVLSLYVGDVVAPYTKGFRPDLEKVDVLKLKPYVDDKAALPNEKEESSGGIGGVICLVAIVLSVAVMISVRAVWRRRRALSQFHDEVF